MGTTIGKDGRVDRLKPRKRLPRVASVGVGHDVFLVPKKATRAVEYPLFGVQHAVIYVPRQSCWEKLKCWLAVEWNVRKRSWADTWQSCIQRKPSFFQRCAVVTLAKPSRSLPAGNVVFESLTDFVAVPERELANLSPRDRGRVQASLLQAVLDFPDNHPLHLLQPVFVGNGKERRLATLEEVREVARERRELLHEFCRKHGKSVPLSKSEDHLAEAKLDYERRIREARHRLAALIGHPAHSPQHRATAASLNQTLMEELLPLMWLALKLGLSLREPQTALSGYQLAVWDPVIVIEEPRWRLPCYGSDVVVFRTAVHWDDDGVTTIA